LEGFQPHSKVKIFWWGNSVKVPPNGSVVAGLERSINGKTVSQFATDNNVFGSQKGTLSSDIIDEYYKKFSSPGFDPTAPANRIGGYFKNGRYIIGEGHHRVAASIKLGMKTGDFKVFNQLINNGLWTKPSINPNYLPFPKF